MDQTQHSDNIDNQLKSKETETELRPTPTSPLLKSTTVISIKDTKKDQLDQNENCDDKENQPIWKRYLGLLLTFISAMMFALNALVVKSLKHIHPFNMGLWTFPVATLLAIPFILFKCFVRKQSVMVGILPLCDNKKVLFFIFIRSVSSISALIFLYYALHYLNVSDALVIASTSTILVYILSWILLNESCGLIPVLTAFLAILGVGVITRPPMLTGAESFNSDLLIGIALAFGCTILITIAILSVRFLQNVYHGVLNFSLYSIGTLQCLIIAAICDVISIPETSWEILLMATSGLLGLLAQTFLAVALQVEDAGPVSLIRTCEVIFSFVFQFVFLGIVPDYLSIVGAILIVSGIILTILRKWMNALPSDNAWKQKYSFILK